MAEEKTQDLEDEVMKQHEVEELTASPLRFGFKRYSSLLRCANNELVDVVDDRHFDYSPSHTDQTHALTIAQQVRRGQIDNKALPDEDSEIADFGESMLPFMNREEMSMEEQRLVARVVKGAERRVAEAEADDLSAPAAETSAEPSQSPVDASEKQG